MATQQERYRSAAPELLRKAREALAEGDLVQASEKGWGAAAQAVKAVAAGRGWPHEGHRQLFEAVRHIVRETGDPRVRELFFGANALHTNFYESWLTPEDVETGLDQVRELLQRTQSLGG